MKFRTVTRWLTAVLMLSYVSAAIGQQVTLDASHFQWGEPGYRIFWQEVTEAFHREYPNIRVVGDDIPYNDYWDQMTVRLQAGNPPDMLLMGGSLHPYIMMGKFEPLGPYMEGSGVLDLYSPGHLSYASRDGEIYQLPYLTLVYPIFYNKRMFEEAGLSIPRTHEEFIQAAIALTKRDSAGNVTQFGYSMLTPPAVYGYYEILVWVESFGGHFARDGQVTVNSPEVIEAFRFLKRLYDEGVTPRQSTMESFRQLFWEERAAMLFDTIGFAGFVAEANPALLEDLDAFLPPGGKGTVLPFGLVMAADSQHKDEVWTFMEFVAREEWRERIVELTLSPSGFAASAPAEMLEESPWLKVALQMATEGVPIPPPGLEEHMERFRRVIVDAMAQVLFENRPVEAALEEAQSTLERMIGR